MFRLGVLTVSTTGHLGERDDTSGKTIQEMLSEPDYQVVLYQVVTDDQEIISDMLVRWCDNEEVDLIMTNGGTGLSPRDVPPEALLSVIDREVPGLPEAMRAATLAKTPMAMLSRSVSGIRGNTLIVTLPGSPKAVAECLAVIKPVLSHALDLLKNQAQGHPDG